MRQTKGNGQMHFPWGEHLSDVNWVTMTGVKCQSSQSEPEMQGGVGREKALTTGGLSSALGSEQGNLFTFLNPSFPTFKARERLRKSGSGSSLGPSDVPVTER